jgi:hypothetical protein
MLETYFFLRKKAVDLCGEVLVTRWEAQCTQAHGTCTEDDLKTLIYTYPKLPVAR